MPKPTYDLLLAVLESHPDARMAEQLSGVTSAQVAAATVRAMSQAPDQASRDAILREVCAYAGIGTTGEAEFDRGTRAKLERMGDRDSFDREAQRIADEAAAAGQYIDPQRIKYLAHAAQHADLQQGVSQRFREIDEHTDRNRAPGPPPREDARRFREDEAHRREVISDAWDTAARLPASHEGPRLRLRHDVSALVEQDRRDRGEISTTTRHVGDSIGLHETVEAAFDAHADYEDQRDPLDSPTLRSASNTV